MRWFFLLVVATLLACVDEPVSDGNESVSVWVYPDMVPCTRGQWVATWVHVVSDKPDLTELSAGGLPSFECGVGDLSDSVPELAVLLIRPGMDAPLGIQEVQVVAELDGQSSTTSFLVEVVPP